MGSGTSSAELRPLPIGTFWGGKVVSSYTTLLTTTLFTTYVTITSQDFLSLSKGIPRANVNSFICPRPGAHFRHNSSSPRCRSVSRWCKQIRETLLTRRCVGVDHGEGATEALKAFIGDHYIRDETPVFKALWRTYNDCQFVDDEG